MRNKRIAAALILAIVCLFLVSCNAKKTQPPKLEEVKDEFILRINNSIEINKVFFGDGLLTIKRDSDEAKESGIYESEDNTNVFIDWEFVSPSCGYYSIDNIKMNAEEAYSTSFLEGIYVAQFTGLYDYVNGEALEAHYYEDNNWIYKNTDPDNPFLVESKSRIFDYDSMTIDEKNSDGSRVYVKINSHLEGEETIENLTLTFDKNENGNWLLSSPTY